MFNLLSATCTVKMCLTCRLFLVFLCTFWPFISHFPLLFPFLHNLFLFSWHFRDFLFFELSFSVLHFLVSSSCSSFFFCSSMVDYSFVKVDCPSVSFPFAHLGCLLEIVEGKHLKRVSVFVGEDCQYRFVLLHFLWFLILLKWLGFWKCLGRLGLVSWKRVYLRLMIARFPWLLPLLFPIKHGTSHVPSQREIWEANQG